MKTGGIIVINQQGIRPRLQVTTETVILIGIYSINRHLPFVRCNGFTRHGYIFCLTDCILLNADAKLLTDDIIQHHQPAAITIINMVRILGCHIRLTEHLHVLWRDPFKLFLREDVIGKTLGHQFLDGFIQILISEIPFFTNMLNHIQRITCVFINAIFTQFMVGFPSV